MKNLLLFILICCCLVSKKGLGQNKSIDSILLVNYDANYRYMDDFDGTPYVGFLKELLDGNEYWLRMAAVGDEEDRQIKYRCTIHRKRLLKRFERLWFRSAPSSYFDLANFPRIKVRMGLKVYRGNEVTYLFIQTKASDYCDRFMIAESQEWHASGRIVRFLKRMKHYERCRRC